MIRQLDVPREQWSVGETTAVRNVLDRVGSDPPTARQWRGTVMLTFADVEEPEPVLMPEIQRFMRALRKHVPHLLYFLDPDPSAGELDLYMAGLAQIEAAPTPDARPYVVATKDLYTQLEDALKAAAVFAIGRGDDWVAAISGHAEHIDRAIPRRIRAFLIDTGHMRA
jgi:hypothetical protein